MGELGRLMRQYDLSSTMIKQAFKKAYLLKEKPEFKDNNPLRSAKFVSEIADTLIKISPEDAVKKVQAVDINGVKSAGEWLFDICICNEATIFDARNNHEEKIISKLYWTVESESNTSLKEFVKDFAKILLVPTQAALYLNGINQKETGNVDLYIERRITSISEFINDKLLAPTIYPEKLFVGFWPSPQKVTINKKNKSQWDHYQNPIELIDRIRLFRYNSDQSSFIEVIK